MSTLDKDKQILFAISPEGQGDGVPVVILGVPSAAWEYMHDGHTHTIDLHRVGLPFKLILYGANSHEEAKSLLNLSGATDLTHADLSIKPIKKK